MTRWRITEFPFSITFSNMPPGIHLYRVFVSDPAGSTEVSLRYEVGPIPAVPGAPFTIDSAEVRTRFGLDDDHIVFHPVSEPYGDIRFTVEQTVAEPLVSLGRASGQELRRRVQELLRAGGYYAELVDKQTRGLVLAATFLQSPYPRRVVRAAAPSLPQAAAAWRYPS